MITTDIVTATFSYKLGVTNLQFIICLGDDVNKLGQRVSNCKVPYSFRVENINSDKYNELHAITHVFMKNTNDKQYNTLTFGNIDCIPYLSDEIQRKLAVKIHPHLRGEDI